MPKNDTITFDFDEAYKICDLNNGHLLKLETKAKSSMILDKIVHSFGTKL